MYEFICLNCGKKAILRTTSCTPKKFCCRTCYSEYVRKRGAVPDTKQEINKATAAVPAKAGASDTSKQLVDPKWCRKCEYGAGGQFNIPHCGYMIKTGTTRTALHPEGLTSTCYEFKPKQRKHKYQAPRK